MGQPASRCARRRGSPRSPGRSPTRQSPKLGRNGAWDVSLVASTWADGCESALPRGGKRSIRSDAAPGDGLSRSDGRETRGQGRGATRKAASDYRTRTPAGKRFRSRRARIGRWIPDLAVREDASKQDVSPPAIQAGDQGHGRGHDQEDEERAWVATCACEYCQAGDW